MRTFISWFFYTLGAIFFVILLSGTYLYLSDAYGIKTLVSVMTTSQSAPVSPVHSQQAVPEEKSAPVPKQQDANPYLSESQEAALENAGINPAALPTSVSDTQKTCLINAVGEARANEIKAGALPTPMEILKAKACF